MVYAGGEAGQLYRIADGSVEEIGSTGGFCGDDLTSLVVANLGRWHLAIGDVGLVGRPLHYPQLE